MSVSKLQQIHEQLKFRHGSLAEEYDEQLMAVTYIQPHARVLELGGNVGRNSCVIASMLHDSSNLVVVESDPRSAALLKDNRDLNGFRFAIEHAAVSARPLEQQGWITRPFDGERVTPGWEAVATLTWPELVAKHGAGFDTLVADCEGALYHILQDDPHFLRGFSTVVIENDFEDIAHKEFVDAEFRRHGLKRVFSKPGGGGPCTDRFYEVWVR